VLWISESCTLTVALAPRIIALIGVSGAAFAQAPGEAGEAAPAGWTRTVGAGITLTRGNSDTTSLNLSFAVASPADGRHQLKSDGLFLRSTASDETIANRVSFNVRDEYHPDERSYFFGQFQFLKDELKGIDYLAAPTVGWGYRVVDGGPTVLTIDGSVGVVWEGSPDAPGSTSAALSLAQKFTHPLSETAAFTQTLTGLWKVSAFDDTLYTFGAGVPAAINPKTSLKVEVLDTYKTRPADPTSRKNDLAILASVVFGG